MADATHPVSPAGHAQAAWDWIAAERTAHRAIETDIETAPAC